MSDPGDGSSADDSHAGSGAAGRGGGDHADEHDGDGGHAEHSHADHDHDTEHADHEHATEHADHEHATEQRRADHEHTDHDHAGHDHADHDADRTGDGSQFGSGGDDVGSDGSVEATFTVPEMDCPSCAGKVETALDRAGADRVETRPTSGTVVVAYDPNAVDGDRLVAAVEDAGYPVTGRRTSGDEAGTSGDGATGTTGTAAPSATSDDLWTSGRAIRTWIGAVLLAVGIGIEFLLPAANARVGSLLGSEVLVADAVFLVAAAIAGTPILRNGYRSARNRNLDIDFLMSVAVVGAVGVTVGFGGSALGAKLYFEAATLAVLFSVAELLERYSMDRARQSLESLVDLSPDEARVRRDGEERTIPAREVRVGDRVLVRPGERIPADGEVVEGTSAVDQSPVTGESVPVDKTVGDEVYAGTVAEEGYLEIDATAAGDDTTLARVARLVEDAQANRTDRERFVERFAARYTPAVVAFAVLTTALSPVVLGVSLATAVVYGLTLLVLACPCAFVIATPVSVVSGITSAARAGVLIKGGDHLESMGEVETVAFDKTGTLTKGELTVTDVIPLGGNTASDVLRCARGVEERSEHPIGEAIVAEADALGDGESPADIATEAHDESSVGVTTGARDESPNGVAADDGAAETDRPVADFESLTGKGVRAELGGVPHYAGKPGLFDELGFDLSHVHATTDGGVVTETSRALCERNDCLDLLADTVPRLQAEGKTVVLVGTDEELEGVIAVADEIRPEARRTVERLHDAGVGTLMITGDNERTARAVADEVGIDEVRAELLPEEKVAAVEASSETGGVAMVGDGVNDAPALATATVGIAMGAAGTDAALETADVALLGDDLGKLPYLHELSRRAVGVIRQNVVASLAAKAGLAVLVPFGYVPIWLAVLAGDAGMTLGVTGNAMRLARVSVDDPEEPVAGQTAD